MSVSTSSLGGSSSNCIPPCPAKSSKVDYKYLATDPLLASYAEDTWLKVFLQSGGTAVQGRHLTCTQQCPLKGSPGHPGTARGTRGIPGAPSMPSHVCSPSCPFYQATKCDGKPRFTADGIPHDGGKKTKVIKTIKVKTL